MLGRRQERFAKANIENVGGATAQPESQTGITVDLRLGLEKLGYLAQHSHNPR